MPKRKEHQIIDGIEKKHCVKCDEWKELTKFPKDNSKWDKLEPRCRNCNYKKTSKWAKDNPEKNNEASKRNHKKRRKEKPEKVREHDHTYRANNLEQLQEYDRKYYNNRYTNDLDFRNKKIIRAKTRVVIESSILIRRENCEICRIDGPLEIHHEAYDEVHILDVVFLCPKCHRMIHND